MAVDGLATDHDLGEVVSIALQNHMAQAVLQLRQHQGKHSCDIYLDLILVSMDVAHQHEELHESTSKVDTWRCVCCFVTVACTDGLRASGISVGDTWANTDAVWMQHVGCNTCRMLDATKGQCTHRLPLNNIVVAAGGAAARGGGGVGGGAGAGGARRSLLPSC